MEVILAIFRLFLGGDPLTVARDGLLKAQQQRLAAENNEQRIEADKQVAFWEGQVTVAVAAASEGTERQKAKMNWWVFGIIIGVALFPGLFLFVSLALYNVFWWENGIWPQDWAIAGFPPPFDGWAQMSIEWIFDPISLPTSVATATVAGKVTGRR